MHDNTKVVLGATQSSARESSYLYPGDPATFLAGLAVRLDDDTTDDLSLLKADGSWLGISLGRSLSNHKRVSVLRTGLRVPVLLEATPARGEIEITDYAALVSGTDDSITVGATTFTAQTGAVTPGQTTFQAATGNTETAASLAAQINAHATAGALVKATAALGVVTLTAIGNTSAGNAIALAYTDNDTNEGATVSGDFLEGGGTASDFVVIGQKVYFSDTTGKADDPNSAATISDAVYVSEPMVGIGEDGVEVAIALVDMPGGL